MKKAKPVKNGTDLLHDPFLNKGTAFTQEERLRLGLTGLLPPQVSTMNDQVIRVMANVRRRASDIDKYVDLLSLLDRNETLFYRVVLENLEELMPIIYTPTVGQGCQLYSHLFRRARGLFITRRERGRIKEVLRHWPRRDVRVIVVTDGERILGLGDLGANGMGISVGKLCLYTACGGVPPGQTLPVALDVGTNNEALLRDPVYLGVRERRIEGASYDALVEEFVSAVGEVFPNALIQFEDFANHNAFRLLKRYRQAARCFNDDIQGTAAVALAGLYSAARLAGKPLKDQVLLFHGAGEAAIGIADLVVGAMRSEGLSRAEAAGRCWFMDSKGLVESSRSDLQEHKRAYAHPARPIADLESAIRELRPTALIGVSGKPAQFTEPVVSAMAALNEKPVIFALSNPTSNAECTAAQAYEWSEGRALFASGSPFPPVSLGGRTFVPGQGNNAYIFPGVGLGVLLSGARLVTDAMFSEAARELASCVTEKELAAGCLYPPLGRIREVSARIAAVVARVAAKEGLAPATARLSLARIEAAQYRPEYPRFA